MNPDFRETGTDAFRSQALNGPDLPPRARKLCLKRLYRTCGLYALLPKTLMVPACYDRTGIPLYRGGYADVWKGEYCGRDVAVKVMRVYSNSDLRKILGVSGYRSPSCGPER